MKRTISSALAFLALSISFNSYGALVWDWELNSSSLIVAPSVSIVLNATLINATESTVVMENLDDSFFTSYLSLQGDFTPDVYSFSWGPNNENDFTNQFSDISLNPGDTFDFIVGTYSPIVGGVPLGNYSTPSISLSFMGSSFIDNSFTATVVPAPSALVLFMSAIGAAGIWSRLTRQVRRTR